MKRLLWISGFALSTCFAEVHTQANESRAIAVDRSQSEFSIELPSNPTTGYHWFLRAVDTDSIQPKNHVFLPPTSQLVGAGGKERWAFSIDPKAFAVPRVFILTMEYSRSWETEGGKVTIFRIYTTTSPTATTIK
jgi:inhibitor of cysteine peptidase